MTNLVSPALVIPAELKPADGRFGSGPARIRPAQLAALAASGGYVLANQPLDVARWRRLPEPPGVPAGRYFLYRID